MSGFFHEKQKGPKPPLPPDSIPCQASSQGVVRHLPVSEVTAYTSAVSVEQFGAKPQRPDPTS
jgi:hypothetical protein